MDTLLNTLAFLVFPYVMLTIFVVGHSYRYLTDRYDWNSKSSELLDKDGQIRVPPFMGRDFDVSRAFLWTVDPAMVVGPNRHHCRHPRLPCDQYRKAFWLDDTDRPYCASPASGDKPPGLEHLPRQSCRGSGLRPIFVVFFGTNNTFFGHGNVLYSMAPWIRKHRDVHPNPNLMLHVSWSYKIHILGALAVLGFSPFSRLVHIWGLPATYMFRPYLSFRRQTAGMP